MHSEELLQKIWIWLAFARELEKEYVFSKEILCQEVY